MRTTARLSFTLLALATSVIPLAAHAQAGVRPGSDLAGKTPLAYPAPDSPFKAHHERMKARIDHAIAANPPAMKGSTMVRFALSESGALESVSTEQATSPEFAQYAVRLVSSLAPFEPFSAEMKKRTDRIEVTTRIAH